MAGTRDPTLPNCVMTPQLHITTAFSPESLAELKGAVDNCLKASNCATGTDDMTNSGMACVARYWNEQNAEHTSHLSLIFKFPIVVAVLNYVGPNVYSFRDVYFVRMSGFFVSFPHTDTYASTSDTLCYLSLLLLLLAVAVDCACKQQFYETTFVETKTWMGCWRWLLLQALGGATCGCVQLIETNFSVLSVRTMPCTGTITFVQRQ